jgi:hypothetical protein
MKDGTMGNAQNCDNGADNLTDSVDCVENVGSSCQSTDLLSS